MPFEWLTPPTHRYKLPKWVSSIRRCVKLERRLILISATDQKPTNYECKFQILVNVCSSQIWNPALHRKHSFQQIHVNKHAKLHKPVRETFTIRRLQIKSSHTFTRKKKVNTNRECEFEILFFYLDTNEQLKTLNLLWLRRIMAHCLVPRRKERDTGESSIRIITCSAYQVHTGVCIFIVESAPYSTCSAQPIPLKWGGSCIYSGLSGN